MSFPKKSIKYVDEFRKIKTLQKLKTISQRLQFKDVFDEEDVKKQQIRKVEEPEIDKSKSEYRKVEQNKVIDILINNNYEKQMVNYGNKDEQIDGQSDMFHDWSKKNKEVKKQTFKFFYAKSSPPEKKKIQKLTFVDLDFVAPKNQESFEFKQKENKYDFQKIVNKYIETSPRDKNYNIAEEKQRSFIIDKTVNKFNGYKKIQDIIEMDELSFLFTDFQYILDEKPTQSQSCLETLKDKFIYYPATNPTSPLEIQYLRDIGLPSRDLNKFKNLNKSNKNISEQILIEEDLMELQLVKESQLNVNPNSMNFSDLANISMKRITPENISLCIRSDKPTRSEVQKLFKRLQKHQAKTLQNAPKQDVEIGTDENEFQKQFGSSIRLLGKSSRVVKKNRLQILIEEIIDLRKEAKNMNFNQINRSKVNQQIYIRLELNLKSLYKLFIDESQYPLNKLKQNIEEVTEHIISEGKDLKILNLIVQCYQQILKNKVFDDNIKNILHQNSNRKIIKEPKVTVYHQRNKKQKIGINRENQTNKGKSKTPVKGSFFKNTMNKTPKRNILPVNQTPTNNKSPFKATKSPFNQRTIKRITISPKKWQ